MCTSPVTFRQHLKAHYFQQSFQPTWCLPLVHQDLASADHCVCLQVYLFTYLLFHAMIHSYEIQHCVVVFWYLQTFVQIYMAFWRQLHHLMMIMAVRWWTSLGYFFRGYHCVRCWCERHLIWLAIHNDLCVFLFDINAKLNIFQYPVTLVIISGLKVIVIMCIRSSFGKMDLVPKGRFSFKSYFVVSEKLVCIVYYSTFIFTRLLPSIMYDDHIFIFKLYFFAHKYIKLLSHRRKSSGFRYQNLT